MHQTPGSGREVCVKFILWLHTLPVGEGEDQVYVGGGGERSGFGMFGGWSAPEHLLALFRQRSPIMRFAPACKDVEKTRAIRCFPPN